MTVEGFHQTSTIERALVPRLSEEAIREQLHTDPDQEHATEQDQDHAPNIDYSISPAHDLNSFANQEHKKASRRPSPNEGTNERLRKLRSAVVYDLYADKKCHTTGSAENGQARRPEIR